MSQWVKTYTSLYDPERIQDARLEVSRLGQEVANCSSQCLYVGLGDIWWNTPEIEQKVVRAVRVESHKDLPIAAKDEFVPLELQEKMKKNEKEEQMKRESRKRGGRI
ncbi:hypothetical protein PMV_407 [Port-miou virus]|uniref:Uncharacterized protein n=1 Tax=Port-miou virus TaxID=1733873 RepID=A0A0N9PZF5_9VIRU|nr:hypothetical protein PMV_407 [Port-miou virus]